MKKIFFLLIGLMLCTAAFAQSTVNIYVSPTGTNNNVSSTTVDNPTKIQIALDSIDAAVVTGATNYNIWLADGTYTGDPVKIIQRKDKNIKIQAHGNNDVTMKRPFKIDGMARSADTESILIKGLKFDGNQMINGDPFVLSRTSEGDHSYPHNVTIDSCSFTGNNDSQKRAIDMFTTGGECSYNTVIKNCTATGCQGFYQSTHDKNLKVDNCQLTECHRGFNVNQVDGSFSISNTTITGATKYVIRLGQSSGTTPKSGSALIRNCSISGLGNADELIVMRGDCPDTLLLENVILEATADDGKVYNLASGVKAVVNKNSTLTLNNGKPDPQDDRLVGVDGTSKLTVGADDLYKELKVADGVFQWDNTSNTWVVADTQYVYPAGIAKNIDNAVAKSIKHENNRDIVYFFTSVPDAVDFMTTSSSQICSMNTLGLDSVGVNVIKNNTLTRTITVSTGKNVTLLDDKAIITRGTGMDYKPMIENNGTLTLGSMDSEDSLIFDGGGFVVTQPIIQNNKNAVLNLMDNVILRNNKSNKSTTVTSAGAAIANGGENAVVNILGSTEISGNSAPMAGAIYTHWSSSTVNISGPAVIKKNSAQSGAAIYMHNGTLNMSNGLITEDTVLISESFSNKKGVIYSGSNSVYLTGGKIVDNVIKVDPSYDVHQLPADIRLFLGYQDWCNLGDSIFIDYVGLNIATVTGNEQDQKIKLTADLNKASATNPIVIIVDSLDKQVLTADAGTTLVKDNYKKFQPSSDTLAINNKGFVVRKPEISIDTVYLLQKGTKYEDYGITTSTGEVPAEALYVIYTQEVDATGQSAKTTADSLVLNMSVDFNHGSPVMLDKKVLSNNQNTNTFVEIPFPSALTDGALSTGRYTINATAKVYTLGLEASDDFTQSDSVYIPTFNIDTLNFLLAGMKFSDYGHCGVGSSTNDGAGDDIIPNDEIYVGYQRSEGGNVDTAFIKVTLKDYTGVEYVYEEGTAAGQILTPGCGHFRQFTNSAKWNPALNLSDAFDGKEFNYTINLYQRTQGAPYFAVGTKTGTYHHEIDRECTIALENAEDCKAMGVEFSVNEANDAITLTYPNFFDKNAVPEAMKQNGVIKVGISFDPQDENLTMVWFDEATDITQTDNKYIVWIPISKAISESTPIVVAENYASTNDTLRLSHTDVNGVYRKTFVVEGTFESAGVIRQIPADLTYHTTGASGVTFSQDGTSAVYNFKFDPNDYTVWNIQDPASFGKDPKHVYAGIYVNRPADTVTAVYCKMNASDAVQSLQEDKLHHLTDTAFVVYPSLGNCANHATKDYTFITKPASASYNYTNLGYDTVYWFAGKKFVKAEFFSIRYYYAPTYTVKYNFNGGGATCDNPYSPGFADTTYIFGRPIVRPDDPFKCGHLFMDWRHGVDSFTVDSFKNVRAGISEATGETVNAEAFGIRADHTLDATWKYFVTLHNPHDTAVVADYSLCEISTRDYVWEPTESQLPYVYTFHTDYLGKYYRDYLTAGNANCDVRFEADAFTENPTVLPVGSTSHVTWTVTDKCGTPFTISQNVNVKFPPCGTDNYNPRLYPFTPYETTYKAIDYEDNTYETVRMGCVCWTKENLKSLKYADGEDIPVANAYFDQEENADEYGRLYTWYSAVNLPENSNETVAPLNADGKPQGVCPSGWYLPSEDDFARMSNLDNIQGASVGIKTDGSNNYWLGHEVGDNSTGFSAKPAGFYNPADERYCNLLGDTYFWSSSSTTTITAPCCALTHSCPTILIQNNNKGNGYSVRCIKYKKFDD